METPMQIIFVGVVIAASVVQWGAAVAVVLAHAQAKASDDARLRSWPALFGRLKKRPSPEQPMR